MPLTDHVLAELLSQVTWAGVFFFLIAYGVVRSGRK